MPAYPPAAFPPLPSTSNTLSSDQHSALVRSSRKLYKVLGDVPDDDIPPSLPPTSSRLELTRAITSDTESTWRKRKPVPPLLELSSGPDYPTLVTSPVYHRSPMHRSSVLSAAPSIVSNAPSTTSYSSTSDASSDISHRRAKFERLRHKLGDDVPTAAVFSTTPPTSIAPTPRPSTSSKKAPSARTRSVAQQPEDARSIAFSVSSDESMHRITFTTRVHSPHAQRTKHVYQTGALPSVPSIPAHLQDEGAGLVHPRQKMAAGSKIGGSDFKAARRAKRDGRTENGMAEPGELVEMVGFMRF